MIAPLPEIKVQTPVPTPGEFAAIFVFGILKQIVWLGPALAIVGILFTVIVTFELDEVQGLFEIVQAKTFAPSPNPVMLVVGNNELVMVPLPEINVHAPAPTPGEFAAMAAVGLLIQIV